MMIESIDTNDTIIDIDTIDTIVDIDNSDSVCIVCLEPTDVYIESCVNDCKYFAHQECTEHWNVIHGNACMICNDGSNARTTDRTNERTIERTNVGFVQNRSQIYSTSRCSRCVMTLSAAFTFFVCMFLAQWFVHLLWSIIVYKDDADHGTNDD